MNAKEISRLFTATFGTLASRYLVAHHNRCQQRNEIIAGVEVPIPSKMTKSPDKAFDPIPGFKDGQVLPRKSQAERNI